MDAKEVASGLVRKPTRVEKVLDWVRRHLHFAIGRHGSKSAEIGFKIEF